MSVVSKTALHTQVSTDLASAQSGGITAAQHRGVEDNIIDSYEDFVGSFTTAEIAALTGMTLRQRVFNTTDNDYEWYDGTRWVKEAHPKYKVYVGRLTQSSSGAPTVFLLDNSFGGDFVLSRINTGEYRATLTDSFTGAYFWSQCKSLVGTSPFTWAKVDNWSADGFNIFTYDDSGNLSDDVLNETEIEVRAYYEYI